MMSKIIVVAVIWVITTHFIVQQSVETIRTELKSIEHKNKRLASNNNQLSISIKYFSALLTKSTNFVPSCLTSNAVSSHLS